MSGSVYEADKLVRTLTRPYPGAYVLEGKYKTIIWEAHIVDKLKLNSQKSVNFYDGFLILDDYETKIFN